MRVEKVGLKLYFTGFHQVIAVHVGDIFTPRKCVNSSIISAAVISKVFRMENRSDLAWIPLLKFINYILRLVVRAIVADYYFIFKVCFLTYYALKTVSDVLFVIVAYYTDRDFGFVKPR